MKFGLVNGVKSEAIKGVRGTCPLCGAELIAKCGDVKMNHWAHKGKLVCDVWWENETEWHRAWKNNFPIEWQEIIHFDEKTGEKHIADTKTTEGWVLEFQHSPIKTEEIQSRNTFYKKIIWVVDGLRRERDRKQLDKTYEHGFTFETNNFQFYEITFLDFSRLLTEWSCCGKPVFLDFNETLMPLVLPIHKKNTVYITPIDIDVFVELANSNQLEELLKTIYEELNEYLNERQKRIQENNNRQYQFRMNKIIMNYNVKRFFKRRRF
jgi:hypothetical protein